jgi:hypothetical protein
MRPSPGLVLAVLMVLVVTQVTRLIAPERGHYVWALVLAAAGLVLGELIAATGRLGAAGVGSVHPLVDLAVMAGLEAAGALLLAPPARRDR